MLCKRQRGDGAMWVLFCLCEHECDITLMWLSATQACLLHSCRAGAAYTVRGHMRSRGHAVAVRAAAAHV